MIADRLKQARTERRLTQKRLSELSGIKQSMLSKLERGEAEGTLNIFELADVLGVEPRWLAKGEGQKINRGQMRLMLNEADHDAVQPLEDGMPVRIFIENKTEYELVIIFESLFKGEQEKLLAYAKGLLAATIKMDNVHHFSPVNIKENKQ